MALFARIYIDYPIHARAGGHLQQVQEHNTFGTRAPDHNTLAIGPRFVDALAPLRNLFRKSCAKRAVKHIRGPLYRITWRRLAEDAGFHPEILIIKSSF